jgi:tRNA G10  N-methylase Trm11
MENYFGSAAVYIPPFLSIKLDRLCAESGYVHSCGEGVFLRNVYKATEDDLFRELAAHLDSTLSGGQKLFLTVYSHEDFTEWDRSQVHNLRDGLDEIKLHISKMHMHTIRLVDVIKHMRTKFGDRLVLPDPGDYRESHRKALRDPSLDHSRSLWLLVDSDVGTVKGLRGDRRFFILYDQQYINENPFIECDENKPAWIDHTTIPHTLAGAMINITRPYWTDKPTTIVDPFMGSGTAYLESLKFGADVICVGGDENPICALVVEDNLRYLSGTDEGSKRLASEVGEIADYFRSVKDPKRARSANDKVIEDCYEDALQIFEKLNLDGQKNDLTFSEDLSSLLNHVEPSVRLMFYLMLRAHRRNTAALDLHLKPWKLLMSDEANELHEQLSRIAQHRWYEQLGANDRPLNVYQGTHSLACSLGSGYMREVLASGRVRAANSCTDAIALLKGLQGKCDVILTDPPYGFNTNDDNAKLARLYADGIDAMICALRPEGQLVIAVPDWSYTGRHLPEFSRPDFITHQVLSSARKSNREVIQSAIQIPNATGLLKPPYYWESEKALRRRILHFRFRRSPSEFLQQRIWPVISMCT